MGCVKSKIINGAIKQYNNIDVIKEQDTTQLDNANERYFAKLNEIFDTSQLKMPRDYYFDKFRSHISITKPTTYGTQTHNK